MSNDRMIGRIWAPARIVLLALSVLGLASMAQAGTQLYGGSLSIQGFGNDTTDQSGTYPLNTFVVLGAPLGVDCNINYGPFSNACGGTYPEAQKGAPLLGSDTATTTGASATRTFSLPASGIARKLGKPATSFTSNSPYGITRPIQCTQTATVSGASLTPGPGCGVPGGSFSYYFPYIYSFTYADLKNNTGSFFAGGGPGSFTHLYKTGGVTKAKVVVTEKSGGNQFGGAMKLLGTYFTFLNQQHATNGNLNVGSGTWLFQYVGAGSNKNGSGTVTGPYTSGGVKPKTFTTYKNTGDGVPVPGSASVSAFGWTTGTVTITAKGRGANVTSPFPTVQRLSGSDNRTASGQGQIQLVSPMLTHWFGVDNDYDTGAIGVLRLEFVPEPEKGLMLVAGISLLGLLYRSRR